MKDKIVCIKSVVMDDGDVAFKKGETYQADTDRYYIIAVNEQGEEHYLGNVRSDDKFYYSHFKKLSQ